MTSIPKTLYDMLDIDNSLLSDVINVPSPFTSALTEMAIKNRCGNMVPYYQTIQDFKTFASYWFSAHQLSFDHLSKIALAEYSPIENTDRYETETISGTSTEDSSNTSTQSGSDSSTETGSVTHEGEISDTDALLKVQRDRASRQKQKKIEAETTAKQQKEAAEKARNAMLTRFVEIYPEVKATDIPQSVWAEVNKSGNLVEAYSRYENKQLRDKVAVLEQNAKNAARSTGSRKSAGASKPKDPFDDIWDSF